MPEKKSLRTEYGKTLVELGKKHDDLIVLDADLAKSTKTELFKKEFPERFFDMGISEADMIATASGFSSVGLKPFCSSFAMFLTGRVYDQIRNSVAYPHWNVKMVSTHAGISVGEDGASHQCNEDIALMRVLPGMTLLCPSDAFMTAHLTKKLYEYESYAYMRLPRNDLDVLYSENDSFEIGKSVVHKIGRDITIIACGAMVSIAKSTLLRFQSLGIDAGLIDMYSIKPLDAESLAQALNKSKALIIAEEHSVIGGLGSAVAQFSSERRPLPIAFIGIEDVFGESGFPDSLFLKYNLTEEAILKKGKMLYDKF
ncbi:TPA: transketolase [candidate division WOR-3 bacterium]|jgi:transketolase|uniref:Transketolase n=1 Tax=candidate division WOR-3 bacterium TaxID=2052148 RepID=A0A350HC77_UNCW3|nr:transketolase [candidate division WOR-3 bacterium]